MQITSSIFYRVTPVVALCLALLSSAPVQVSAGDQGSTPGANSFGALSIQAPSCTTNFNDVHSTDYYYGAVRYLACRGVLGGYPDGSFRPGNPTTRGQLAKIQVLAKGWPIVLPPAPSFSDVPAGHTFYTYIETARAHNVLNGYQDGTFRPETNITRSQLAKIVVTSEGWPLIVPATPTFLDVPTTSAFYPHVETAAARGVISGYQDGTFRPGNPATRGQIAKIIYNTIGSQLTAEEQQTVNLINTRRAAMGLRTLVVHPALTLAARRHSNDIGPLGLCQHDGTDGSSPWDRIAQAGYPGSGRGEVVGCNYSTPQAVVDGWWASPGHYGVLTGNDVSEIGCGWWYTGQGTGWQTCVTGSNP